MRIERHATLIRVGLGYLTLQIGLVAAMILIAPRAFYDDFPAGPSAWVSVLPPYNEHLIRDFGSAGLGLAVVAGLAAIWMDRRLVQAACIALFAGSLPHAIYHATETGALDAGDNVATLFALFLQALLPLALLWLATGARQRPATGSVVAGDQVPGAA
ncbi:MAG TPA: hypothetical protein VFN15_05645 [Solirubrobacterales bacterium]|nr:hypothetical protein [Solirubrobacterales bacterium]